MRLWKWMAEPVPTCRAYFYLFWAALAVIVALAIPAAASSSTLVPLWANVHRDHKAFPTSADLAPFTDAAGWPDQRVSGPVWWGYVKGTRTARANLPEKWYLHVNGKRVHDKVWKNLFVLNPGKSGVRHFAAQNCVVRCFLDALGDGARYRTTPSILDRWSQSEWRKAVRGLIAAVVNTGDEVLPNSAFSPDSVRSYTALTGRASTESFTSLRSLPLVKAGKLWVFGKTNSDNGCRRLLAAYLIGKGRGDKFSCFKLGTVPYRVPPTLEGEPVGKASGKATRINNGWRRGYAHAVVISRYDGSYSIRSRP